MWSRAQSDGARQTALMYSLVEVKQFSFRLLGQKKKARAGEMVTPHGLVKTPTFMPVGTQGSVKALSPEDLHQAGAQIILGNTYHLYLRPGAEVVKKLGGLAKFSSWNSPTLTDSGGYQVSSLGLFQENRAETLSVVDDDGVTFRSHLDGSNHRFTPEKSIEIQHQLGADVIMAFDEATPDKGKRYARQAMDRTHRWAERSLKRHQEILTLPSPALFGIIQGGNYRDLRRISAKFVSSLPLSGIAIGGGSIGQDVLETQENVDWVYDLLPQDKPLYLMGVGVGPEDIIGAVEAGADIFDCVAPTKLARSGLLYHGRLKASGGKWAWESDFPKGRISIGNSRFRTDKNPILEDCNCYSCQAGFSRAYLNHLFRAKELLYYRLASIHNVRLITRLCENLRQDILS